MWIKCKDCGETIVINSGACLHRGESVGVIATPEQMSYYQIVRETIHGLDSLRITTSIAGLTFNFSLLTAAAFLWNHNSLPQICTATYFFQVSNIASVIFCLIAGTVNLAFLRKLGMFNAFIGQGVELGKRLEAAWIPQEENRLTFLFEKSNPYAGKRGDYIFKFALWVMTAVSYVAACLFIWHFGQELWKC